MKIALLMIASLLLTFSTLARSQSESGGATATQATAPTDGATFDIYALIEKLADDLEREFVVDGLLPRRFPAGSIAGDDDYDTLLAVLRLGQFVAYETGNQIHIVPNAQMRAMPTRILQEDDRRVPDNEVITRILEVSGISPAQLVPILRPMMGQTAQLTASQNNNRLVIVDYYDNVRRITAVIRELEKGAAAE